jgi:membrane-associated phospholipid phosphatase
VGTALAISGLCLVGLALIWVVTNLVPAAHREDAVVLHAFTQLERPRLDSWATSLTSLLDPAQFVAWGLVLLTVALVRRRPRTAVAIVAIMVLAPLTTEALKPLVAHPHAQLGLGTRVPPASWPSGHSTAALALVLCALLVVPRGLRAPVALVGGGFAAGVGCSQLILGRHMPSDVLGGYLVAILWTALAVAALRAAAPASRRRLG